MVVKNFKHRGLIAFLLFLVILIGLLAYQNAKDFSLLKKAFDDEKKELEKELDNVIADYQRVINENNDFSNKLEGQLQKIVLIRDTIHRLKTSNYNLLRVYKKRISILEKENQQLLKKLDSIKVLNSNLFNENDSVRVILSETEELNSKLTQNNQALEKKIESAEILEISDIQIQSMKKRSDGELTTTYRSWKTDVFNIQFNLLENKIIDKGIIPIHIQLINPKNEIKAVKGKLKLKNGKTITYSDVIEADYYNKQLSIMSLIEVNKNEMEQGIYKIRVYVNKIFIKESTIKLK